MTNELYPWQRECLDLWEKNQYRGIVQAVTGAGKTAVALAGVERLASAAGARLRVKIVVPGKSLLLQWKRALESLPAGVVGVRRTSIGMCGGGFTAAEETDYMIYVIHSARYRLARQILSELREGYTVLLIADECHHYSSGENRKIFEFLPYAKKLPGHYCSLGLSATMKGAGLERVLVPALGPEIYHYGLERALRRGTVCAFAVWQVAVSFAPKEQEEYDALTEEMICVRRELFRLLPGLRYCESASFFAHLKELVKAKEGKAARMARTYLWLSYKRKRRVCLAKARTDCVIELLRCLDAGKQTLIFGESISQIEQLYVVLKQEYPARVGRYHSKMGAVANQNTLERFRAGNIQILLTCRALDEGIDVPQAAVGIILSGTSMERQRLQRLGRILRKADGKRLACLYYLFVADSKEERAYFPQGAECFRVENLSFDYESRAFYFPSYERAAAKVMERMVDRGLSESFCREAVQCLKRGYLREDWLLPPDECRAHVREAIGVREKNYWICMEQMAKSISEKNENECKD